MITAAIALAAAATGSLPDPQNDPDVHCVAAVTFALGVMMKSEDADPKALIGLTAITWYYIGKIDALRPNFDYKTSLVKLFDSPAFGEHLQANLQRCGEEAEQRGKAIEQLGEDLQKAAPLSPMKPG